jgi:hypothetical protein
MAIHRVSQRCRNSEVSYNIGNGGTPVSPTKLKILEGSRARLVG